MCRVYGVTRAGFYGWCSRERSEREHQNETLAKRIGAVHRASRGTYGSPRVYQVLKSKGCRVGENRVARLMRVHGIKARVATIRYTNPTLQRFFSATRNKQLDVDPSSPDQVWVGDITYLKVGAIYRYLAVVMDRYSRRVLGWAYGKRKDVALTLRALDRAVRYRRPRARSDLPHRPGNRVRCSWLQGASCRAGHHPEHEPSGESYRQRVHRVLLSLNED